ncbi:MAG: hypothetical protein HY219_01800 [Candidatus Staskawiczbacteria bacterium]|nr:hypothetical protein [Candidatus Staskawiczbacteria bacterium]
MNKIKISFLATLLIAIVLSFVGFAVIEAMTEQERQDLIAQIQQQIAQLQNRLSQLQSQTPSSAWCHTFSVSLRYGDTGAEVKSLQDALDREGLYSVSNGYSNDFNEQVSSAVVAFQEKYASEILVPLGLKHGTGYIGVSTRAKLNQIYRCAASSNENSSACADLSQKITAELKNVKSCSTDADCTIGSDYTPCTFAICSSPLNKNYNLTKIKELSNEYNKGCIRGCPAYGCMDPARAKAVCVNSQCAIQWPSK